jgi:hypothetical protein
MHAEVTVGIVGPVFEMVGATCEDYGDLPPVRHAGLEVNRRTGVGEVGYDEIATLQACQDLVVDVFVPN